MTEKSAVIVVVEGYNDMASIGTILKEHFSSTETQFVITRGDITSRDGVTPANVITKSSKPRLIRSESSMAINGKISSVLFI